METDVRAGAGCDAALSQARQTAIELINNVGAAARVAADAGL